MPHITTSSGNGLVSIYSPMNRGKEPPSKEYLTVGQLFKETYTVQFNGQKKRELGLMSWPENTNGTLAEMRVLFINQLVAKLEDMPLSKQQPVILVSLGSSGLLTEYFIHKGLTDAGFTNLHWRFLDVLYHPGQQELEVVKDFAFRAKARVETFTSNKDYLNPMALSKPSLLQDCQAGGVVLLSLDSPLPPFGVIQGNFAIMDNDICLASLQGAIHQSDATYLFAYLNKSEFTFEQSPSAKGLSSLRLVSGP